MEENASNSMGEKKLLNDQFQRLFELSPDCLFKIRLTDFNFVKVNNRACDTFGYTKEEFCRLSVADFEFNEAALVAVKEACDEFPIGKVVAANGRAKHKNGHFLVTEVHFCKLDEAYGMAVVRDATEAQKLKKLNEEYSTTLKIVERQNMMLQLNRDVLKMVVQHLPLKHILHRLCESMEEYGAGVKVSVLLLAKNGKQLFSGAAPSLPKTYVDAIDGGEIGPKAGSCGTAAFLKKTIIVEDIATSELWEDYKDFALGHNLRACWSTPIISSDDVVLGTFAMYFDEVKGPSDKEWELVNIATDLTKIAIEQSNYQKSLKQINSDYAAQNNALEAATMQLEEDKKILIDNEEKLKEAQRLSKVGHWEFNFDTQELLWSEEQYRTYELKGVAGNQLYRAYRNRIHPEDLDYLDAVILRALDSKEEFRYEHRIICSKQEIKHILGIGKLVYRDGVIIGVRGTEQDVTALKIAQEAAFDNERKLNELLGNINEIVFAVDLVNSHKYDNPITYINGDTIGILGYTHEELIAISVLWTDRIHPDDLGDVLRVSGELHRTKKQVVREYRFKHKKGHYIWIEDNVSLGWSGDKKYQKLYGSVRDITERKEAEDALLESKERLQLATQAAKLGSYDWRIKEKTMHWDEQMHILFGLELDSKLDRNRYFANVLHPDDRKRIFSSVREGLQPSFTKTHLKSDYRIVLGNEVRYIETYVMLFRDKHNVVNRIIGTCLDVTERKHTEALLISNEEKDILLKEIHHRVKNNLQVITSLLSLQSSFFEKEEQRDLFADSQYRINSMAIVHEMLYQSDNLSQLDYRGYLEELSQFLIRSMKGFSNKVQLKMDVPHIILGMDTAVPLGLLINEILTNSLKYGIKGKNEGTISIKITEVEKNKAEEKVSYVLEIGDDGEGFSESINSKTTNSLGLKLIKNLTRQLEGKIERDYTKKGTNYILWFKEIS